MNKQIILHAGVTGAARSQIAERPEKNRKYPCLLTRAELKAIFAEQLG